jgi:hypothetical protein
MVAIRLAMAAALIVAVFVVLVRPAAAEVRNRETVVTFDRDVEIPGKILHPGTYIFRLADSPSSRHIVLVLDRQGRTVAVCLTAPVQRASAVGGTQMTFERRPGSGSAALAKWFYPWELEGEEFLYFGRPLQ